MRLDKIFNPKTIAVIGASDNEGSVGHALINNLLNSDYKGIIYPVNNRRESVHSVKAYDSVGEIDDKIDLAIIATPAGTVPAIVKDCGEAGVGGVIIISAGFSEAGKAGEKLSQEIKNLGKQYGMRIVGPNCLGFIRPKIHLNASFSSKMALPGNIAFISQSGALCTAILDWSLKNNVGFSYFISIGSMLDVSFDDLIDYFGQDKNTDSILIYMESLKNARKFMSAARAFSRNKPIIVLKVGRSSEGAKAARSHTGSIAGNDEIFKVAFERAGIVRVDTTVALFHTAKALAMQPRPAGNRMAVITNAGGPGVIATDALIYSKGQIAKFEKKTYEGLNKILPKFWSQNNPVDILGDAGPKRYRQAIEICLQDKNIDAVLIILTPQAMTDPTAVANKIVSIKKKYGKTILASWMGGNEVAAGRQILEAGNIPIYRQPEDAVRSFTYLCNYTKNLNLLNETPASIPHAFNPKINENKNLIENAVKKNRFTLNEVEAREFLSNYDIPVIKSMIAESATEAGKQAASIGFPAAMKIISSDILHKTDVDCVKLNINSPSEASQAYKKIIAAAKKFKPKARIEGVLISEMVKKRYELLIGAKKDNIFGPVIVFGMGGIAVEVFKDTKIGLPPLNMSLSLHMIKETKIYKLLKGFRGLPGVDVQAIQFLLYKFAYLVADFPEIKEIDINPFAVDENGGMVLDAKVILDTSLIDKNLSAYSHLIISPYPKEYTSKFIFKNGERAVLRPIKPEDEPMEAEMFKTFSKKTQRHRFFGLIRDITHDLLIRYTQIDYDREIAIIAEVGEKGKKKMAGVARLINDPFKDEAEFAVVVGDPWQFQGLGKKFTDIIINIAKQRKIKKIWAKFLPENESIQAILSKRGFALMRKGKIGYAELKLID
ncbi:MAG: bifunctional acetate--CoA ligase family protein/GNAT family N-acetyltransferase [Patescibacteria group bacterium]|nr:bifunctional acetate--CoA ligase family protein/GNAT family N-acetyltransferase [Patescibacteria group bacterium]